MKKKKKRRERERKKEKLKKYGKGYYRKRMQKFAKGKKEYVQSYNEIVSEKKR